MVGLPYSGLRVCCPPTLHQCPLPVPTWTLHPGGQLGGELSPAPWGPPPP